MNANFFVIICSIFMVSCSSALKSSDTNLIGKWEIISVEEITEKKPGGYLIDNLSFFGIAVWSQSTGKYFDFKKGGEVKSDIVDSEKLVKINFTYRINENKIEFYGINPHKNIKDSELLFFAEYSKLSDKLIEIKLDGVLRVTLENK